jgi:hypothetical protein
MARINKETKVWINFKVFGSLVHIFKIDMKPNGAHSKFFQHISFHLEDTSLSLG